MSFTVIIPARYDSTRLPGKPLADIHGKPMIQWVYEQACRSGAEHVVIATDDNRVKQAAQSFSAPVCMTSSRHQSGTERLAEAIDLLNIPSDRIVVNVQGDEPMIPVSMINQVANNLANSHAPMSTLAAPIASKEDVFNPHVVKVVCDKNGYAMYFSRASIPWYREWNDTTSAKVQQPLLRHIGIYAYRAGFVKEYINWPTSTLEQVEGLEQLRVLWHGEKIHVDITAETLGVGVDTEQDLMEVRKRILD
ncbi:3-deoxy-manno-octulosonate cytidylyltransferase [Vibrio marisflavi]|uniref:3-deoxy-manno-octulosonate cytidylyltransferase n=1 Tax=Vibrio marisflavi CECT 7928 TaxID=634439 RepID=A0ABN8E508_9VIBR|nr:3-deoxy-manno-octulosonate cytidylyltransferase [Vibrio marisflavi]CAH0540645.1 3-deoxy-manno-octulosonate cytidylyltransferase [Vibrio marisflavi CECT 7928]